MTGALVILAILLVGGLAIYICDGPGRRMVAARRKKPNSDPAEHEERPESSPEMGEEEGECCGRHAVCERTSLTPLTDIPEYYDDEELDRFRGKSPVDYTPDETEEFRDILLTLLPEDVAGWARSLQLRGIEPPEEIRDELLMIVRELRDRG